MELLPPPLGLPLSEPDQPRTHLQLLSISGEAVAAAKEAAAVAEAAATKEAAAVAAAVAVAPIRSVPSTDKIAVARKLLWNGVLKVTGPGSQGPIIEIYVAHSTKSIGLSERFLQVHHMLAPPTAW
jgi:hypothetical protein